MRIDLPYIMTDRDRHGNLRVYYRRPGQPKVRLRAEPGSDEFLEEYRRARAGEVPTAPARPEPRPPAKENSLGWLCQRYCQSARFTMLDPRTQRVRRNILDRICEKEGQHDFRLLRPRHVRERRDDLADRPEAANALVKALRQVYACAIEDELTETNPAALVPYIKTGSQGFHTWTVEEVRQYEERHPVGTKARLALALLLYTGQRRSDIVQFGRQHVRNEWLVFTQHKNRNRSPVTLEIPVLPELRAVIDKSPCGDLTFLVTAFDNAFTSNGFGNRFRKWCDEAKLPQCSAHGLRKAGASIAAENGATERQLMAIFGWKTAKEASRYTRAARQKVLAGSAMSLLVAGQGENEIAPPSGAMVPGGAKSPSKSLKNKKV